MLYPENIEEKIEFSKIKQLLYDNCATSIGRKFVENISFSYDLETIIQQLNQTNEMKTLLTNNINFNLSDFYDITEEIKNIKTEGAFPELDTVINFKLSYKTFINIRNSIIRVSEKFSIPDLLSITTNLNENYFLLSYTESIINEKGEISDDASENLKFIRKEINKKKYLSQKILENILSKHIKEGNLPQETELTVRNSRYVIPIPIQNKKSIKGFIHDESSTGQTLYIEPAEVFELNNEISELRYEERREIIKILTEWANKIRPYINDILRNLEYVGKIDFIRAKAILAIKLNAQKPSISTNNEFYFIKAYHPLLYLKNIEKKIPTIPFDLEFNNKNRILVISGPNAGGKTVCMKTIGLLQYMLQCGLLVTTDSASKMKIFKKILVHIGDEQSIENELSTYSSHLSALNKFCNNASEDTLFLIDELGSGTEPHFGGAIAEAILHFLNNQKAFGVVTTHYSNIKSMAEKTEGLFNAAMLFDIEKNAPLYILKTGKQGSSYSFEIAEKSGLNKEIINYAKQIAGKDIVDFEKKLVDIENIFLKNKKLNAELQEKEQFLNQLIKEYQILIDNNKKIKLQFEKQYQEKINKAKKESKELLIQANKVIDEILEKIKEEKKTKNIEKIRELKKELNKEIEELIKINSENNSSQNLTTDLSNEEKDQIKIGDKIKITDSDAIGIVEEIKDEEITVLFGTVRVFLTKDKIHKISENDSQSNINRKNNFSDELIEKKKYFRPEIDIRGKRVDESINIVENFISDAIMLGYNKIKIIHGKGNGILRKVVREKLKQMNKVQSFTDEAEDKGGNGVTIVFLE